MAQVQRMVRESARLARWFEPQNESPLIQGSPCCPQFTYLSSSVQRVYAQNPAQPGSPDNQPPVRPQQPPLQQHQESQQAQPQNAASDDTDLSFDNLVAFALAAAGVPSIPSTPVNTRQGRGGVASAISSAVSRMASDVLLFGDSSQQPQNWSRPSIVSPMPPMDSSAPPPIFMPIQIVNLTKLDLVSVAISALPRLDNVKYLHLKWVGFHKFGSGVTFVHWLIRILF